MSFQRPSALFAPRPCAAATLQLALLLHAAAAKADEPADTQLAYTGPAQQIEITGSREAGNGGYDVQATRGATRLDLSLRETPQSVSVLTRALIDDLGARSAQDLLQHATGLQVERVETDRSYYTARGFEVSNFQLDGVGLPFATGDQLGDIDTALYERVEILRGANGLMSATGNPSATVNFIRKRPTSDLQASVAATFGSWNRKRLDVDVSSPLTSDGTVRARVVAAAEKGDSYLDRYSLEKQVLGLTADAKLSAATTFTFGLSRQDNRPNGTMWGALPLFYADTLTPTHYARSASTAPSWSYWNTLDDQAFAELSHKLNDRWQLKAVLTRRELSSDSELLYVFGAPNRATGDGLATWPSKYNHAERQTLADFSATGRFTLGGRQHDLVLGLNASRSENALRSHDAAGGAITEADMLAGLSPRPVFPDNVTGQADFTDRRRSLFGVVRWSAADRLHLITGVNLTRAQSEGEQYGEPHRYARTKALPYLGATWDLDDQHSLYASHAGIFNPQNKIDHDRQVLPPIEGRNTELGLKGEWFGGQLNGSAAVFRTRQDNTAVQAGYQVDPVNGNYTYYEGENATSTGVELELAGTVSRGWELAAGYTQMRIKDSAGEDARTYMPRRMLRLSTSYRLAALPALKVGAALRWQSDIHRTDDNTGVPIVQKAYAIGDLMASFDLTHDLTLSAHVRNVGNVKALTSLQWNQAYWNEPRNGSVTLQWRY
jgi:outer membrane receptor for ferric coprogen and ferric-rhodotorulic acid